jgi:hypothetical protein
MREMLEDLVNIGQNLGVLDEIVKTVNLSMESIGIG